MPPIALHVAAPSAHVDDLAPWTAPAADAGHRALKAVFFCGFSGLSIGLHGAAIVLAFLGVLLPVPLLAQACNTPRLVVRPPEPRVEVAIVERKPEPPPAPEPPPPEPPPPEHVDGHVGAVLEVGAAKPNKVKKAHRAKHLDQLAELRATDTALFAILGARGDEGNVLGGVEGGVALSGLIGSADGAGGLGLRGVGEGGGGLAVGIGGGAGVVGRGEGGLGDLAVAPRARMRTQASLVVPDGVPDDTEDCLLQVRVDETGAVDVIRVVRSSGVPAFDDACRAMAQRSSYEPIAGNVRVRCRAG